ncbi:L-alanine exporter AlaE [Candidatus Pacearchaeota archaeon]|nr:L-alanine exporter AlaE [Candidatus Pacearchaeota archaeon]
MGKVKDWIKKDSKFYAVDTLAMLVESHPLFAAIEVGVAGMSDEMSINARVVGTIVACGGLGYVFGKGRDLSKKLFKITNKTKEVVQHAHDIGYAFALNLAITPPMYTLSQLMAGEDLDFKKIAIGTISASILGGINGSPMGYSIDVFRDLTGIKECNRKSYPNLVKRQGSKIKKTIAVGLIAASMGAMGLIYSATPNKAKESQKYQIEQVENIPKSYHNLESKIK